MKESRIHRTSAPDCVQERDGEGAHSTASGTRVDTKPEAEILDSLESSRTATFISFMRTNRRPADIARRAAKALSSRAPSRDGFRRETFALPREAAREKAREMFRRFPKAAYMTEIESWRVLPGDRIEFTVRRLASSD